MMTISDFDTATNSYGDWESRSGASLFTEHQKSVAEKLLRGSDLNEAVLIDGDVPDWISSRSENSLELISQ